MTEGAGFLLENEVAKKLGHLPMSRAIHKSTWGRPLPEVISERIPNINVERFMSLVTDEMKKRTEQKLFDTLSNQTISTLKFLIEKGYSISVLTSRIFNESEHLLSKKYPLSTFVPSDRFFYKEKTQYKKPDPRVFQKVLKHLKALPSEAVYVGDSPTDSIASKLSGMSFVASLESGLRTRGDFPKGFVDMYIGQISDLKKMHKVIKNRMVIKSHADLVIEKHGLSSVPHDYFKPYIKKDAPQRSLPIWGMRTRW